MSGGRVMPTTRRSSTDLGTPPDSWDAHDRRQAEAALAASVVTDAPDGVDDVRSIGLAALRALLERVAEERSDWRIAQAEMAAELARLRDAGRPALIAALAAAQAEFPSIPKTKEATVQTKSGGTYTYTYADLADVLGAVRPVLGAHGLALTQTTRSIGEGRVMLVTTLHHGHETLESEFPLTIGDKSPQDVGAVMSYARRYQICAVLGIAAEDDTDAQHITADRPTQQQRQQPARPQQQRPQRQQRPPANRQTNTAAARQARQAAQPADTDDTPPPATTDSPAAVPRHETIRARMLRLLPTARQPERALFVANVIGRDTNSLRDLTDDELDAVDDRLNRIEAADLAVLFTAEGVEWHDLNDDDPPTEEPTS